MALLGVARLTLSAVPAARLQLATGRRVELQGLVRQRPFQPFILNFENGDRITVEHPENVAFDPVGRSNRLLVITGEIVVLINLESVTGPVLQDPGQTIGA